eukprot:2741010-Prymnesium_polylepis.1
MDRLRLLLGREHRSSPGLAVQFQRQTTANRKDDPELKALSLVEARRVLYTRWDHLLLDFDFGLPLQG